MHTLIGQYIAHTVSIDCPSSLQQDSCFKAHSHPPILFTFLDQYPFQGTELAWGIPTPLWARGSSLMKRNVDAPPLSHDAVHMPQLEAPSCRGPVVYLFLASILLRFTAQRARLLGWLRTLVYIRRRSKWMGPKLRQLDAGGFQYRECDESKKIINSVGK
jgi:hypothetical protein